MLFRNVLSRVLAQGRGSDEDLGPHTSVELLGWFGTFGRKCSFASFVPLIATLILVGDAILATFAGLDMLNRGTRSPYVQFVTSLSLATLYLVLMIVTLVQYMYERVLRFRFHWLWMMTLVSLLAWINFGIWASWLVKFASEADGVRGSDGTPFVAWVGANAAGLAGFFARLLVFAMGQGLRYTFDRSLEIQGLLLASTTGGKSLVEGLEQGEMAGFLPQQQQQQQQYPQMQMQQYQQQQQQIPLYEEGGANPEMAGMPMHYASGPGQPMYAGTNFQSRQQVRRHRHPPRVARTPGHGAGRSGRMFG